MKIWMGNSRNRSSPNGGRRFEPLSSSDTSAREITSSHPTKTTIEPNCERGREAVSRRQPQPFISSVYLHVWDALIDRNRIGQLGNRRASRLAGQGCAWRRGCQCRKVIGRGSGVQHIVRWGYNPGGVYVFRRHHVDIERMCCTTTVLSGSSISPPSDSDAARNIRSSTRKRSLPSGRR